MLGPDQLLWRLLCLATYLPLLLLVRVADLDDVRGVVALIRRRGAG